MDYQNLEHMSMWQLKKKFKIKTHGNMTRTKLIEKIKGKYFRYEQKTRQELLRIAKVPIQKGLTKEKLIQIIKGEHDVCSTSESNSHDTRIGSTEEGGPCESSGSTSDEGRGLLDGGSEERYFHACQEAENPSENVCNDII